MVSPTPPPPDGGAGAIDGEPDRERCRSRSSLAAGAGIADAAGEERPRRQCRRRRGGPGLLDGRRRAPRHGCAVVAAADRVPIGLSAGSDVELAPGSPSGSEVRRSPAIPSVASPAASGRVKAISGDPKRATRPRQPRGRSRAASASVSRKSRVRRGVGSALVAATIDRRSPSSSAQAGHSATRVGPSRSSALPASGRHGEARDQRVIVVGAGVRKVRHGVQTTSTTEQFHPVLEQRRAAPGARDGFGT